MNMLIAKLLEPVSPDKPCGPDLSYDPRMDALEIKLAGKPEVDIGSVKRPAEPPDWRELRDQSEEFLAQSKHIRVAVMLCCSLLKTEGAPGFRDGLEFIWRLLEKHWAALYPSLDPEDNNDPTQRLNLLSALTAKRGMLQGWLTFVDYLYTTPLCQPKGVPAITFEQIEAAKVRATQPANAGPSPSDGPNLAKIDALLRGDANDQVKATHQALGQALEAANGLDRFLTDTLGAANTISFDVLQKTLQLMAAALAPYLNASAALIPAPGSGAAGLSTLPEVVSGTAITVSGPIRSRQDVARALESICEYYRQAEPCSPVPYLLKRAQRLALMNFVEAVQELNLGNVDSLRPSMGSALDGTAPPGQTAPAA